MEVGIEITSDEGTTPCGLWMLGFGFREQADTMKANKIKVMGRIVRLYFYSGTILVVDSSLRKGV